LALACAGHAAASRRLAKPLAGIRALGVEGAVGASPDGVVADKADVAVGVEEAGLDANLGGGRT